MERFHSQEPKNGADLLNDDYVVSAIRDNFPQFKVQTEDVEHIGTGYDNVAFRVKGKYIFRFSNEEGPWDKGEREIRLLPMLEKALEIPVPHVEYAALQSNGRYFMGYQMIDGVPFTKGMYESLSPDKQRQTLDRLGACLKDLFTFPVDEARKIKVADRNMREWHTRIWNNVEPHLNTFFTPEEHTKLKHAFGVYLADEHNFNYKPALVNTDMQAEHILFDESKKDFSGIIDWTDICIADPALTFPALYRSYGKDITGELLKKSIGETEMDKVVFLSLATSLRRFVARKQEGHEERAQKHLKAVKQDLSEM